MREREKVTKMHIEPKKEEEEEEMSCLYTAWLFRFLLKFKTRKTKYDIKFNLIKKKERKKERI